VTWREADHPRDPDGQFTESWANRLSAALPGGSIFDTFIDPEFGEPSEVMVEQASDWAHERFDYTDRTTGYRSRVTGIEHGGDGFNIHGVFEDGDTEIGHYQIGILKDEDGSRAAVVEGVYLDQDRRGEGLAKRWVARLEDAARAEGIKTISMWDMSSGFWEHLGYVRGRWSQGSKQL